MTNDKKSPAQGGEMPPVERAAITGSGGIDTVRGAKPADNAAQERNTNAAALTDDFRGNDTNLVRSIEALIALNDEGALVPHGIGGLARVLLSAAAVRLTSPRAAVPRHVLASLECTAVWLEKGNDPQDAARELRACLAKIDAAPAAPVAELVPDPLRRRVERLLVELHAEGRLSEGQCAKMLDISRVDWRELAEFLAPAAQAVAADGARAKDVVTREQVMEWARTANIETGWFTEQLIAALGDFAILARAVASPATASGLPAWFDTFLTNVCEIPDRNSPVGEPDAIIATLNELKHCALNAIEECAGDVPAAAEEQVARLDDADIDTIAESMPGGLASFMKQWGWRQFARAVEDEVVLNVSRAPRGASGQSFQARVQPWMLECFGPTIAADRVERNHRFLEEAIELVQSLGCTASEAHQLVDYTFGRPVGEPAQEVGGVMVTLAALCLANTLDMHAAGETELARISAPAMVEKIRAKQAAKPKHSPLPEAPADAGEAVSSFIRDVAAQKPEKPDHWSSCGQCEHNRDRAQDLLDAAQGAQGGKGGDRG